MFRNKKSKKVMFTESVTVAIERFRQAVEVLLGSPVAPISIDVTPGKIMRSFPMSNLRVKDREVDVTMSLRVPDAWRSTGSRILRLEGRIFVAQSTPSAGGSWQVLHDHMNKFSLVEYVSADVEEVRWKRAYYVCWTLGEKPFFPYVMVCEDCCHEYGERMRFPSDRKVSECSESWLNERNLPVRTRVGQTYADAYDMDGWFKFETPEQTMERSKQ